MTADLKLFKEGKRYTLGFDPSGDFAKDYGFDGHLAYSLLGEKRATESEVLDSSLRRGWIGNEFSEIENGSKIWLYEQERITRTVLNGVRDAALESIQWMAEYGIFEFSSVEATFSSGNIVLRLQIQRPNSLSENRYFEMWNNTGS